MIIVLGACIYYINGMTNMWDYELKNFEKPLTMADREAIGVVNFADNNKFLLGWEL